MSQNAQPILEVCDEENHLQIDENTENKISNTIEEKYIPKLDIDGKDINEIKIFENQQQPELVQYNTNLIGDQSSLKQSGLFCNISEEYIKEVAENQQNMECSNMKDEENIELANIKNQQNIEIVNIKNQQNIEIDNIKNKQNIEINNIVDKQNIEMDNIVDKKKIKPVDKQNIESVNKEEELSDHQNNIEMKMSFNKQEMEKMELISEIGVVSQQLIDKTKNEIENEQIIASVNEETFSKNQTNEINNSSIQKIENESESQLPIENQHSANDAIDIQSNELINVKAQNNNSEENKEMESQTYREIEFVCCVSSDSELDSDSDSTSVSSLSPAEMDLDNKDKSNNKECEENKDIVAPSPSVPKPPPKVRRPHKWDILTEGDLPSIQDMQINVKEEEAKVIGAVSQIVKNHVVVESIPDLPVIDLNSVLFVDKGRRALGHVFDVFGSIDLPNYMVRFNSADHVTERGISVGDDVYFAPQTSHTNYVHIAQLMSHRGSDASWVGNMAVPTSLQDYSDDEEERRVKRKGKKTKETFQPNGDVEARPKRTQHNPFRAPPQPPHRHRDYDSRRDDSRDSPSPFGRNWISSSPCPSPSPSNASSIDWLSWTPPPVLRSSPRPSTSSQFGCQQSHSPRPPFTSSPCGPNAASPFRGGPPPFGYPPVNRGPYQVNQPPRDSNAPHLYTNVPPPIHPSFGVNGHMSHFNGLHAGGFSGPPVPVFGMNILPPLCPPNILPPNVASQPTHRPPSNIVVVNTAVPPPTFSREQNSTFRNGSSPFSNGGNNGPSQFYNGGNIGLSPFSNGGNNSTPQFFNNGGAIGAFPFGNNGSTSPFANNIGPSFANGGGNISAPPPLNPMWRPPNGGQFNPPR